MISILSLFPNSGSVSVLCLFAFSLLLFYPCGRFCLAVSSSHCAGIKTVSLESSYIWLSFFCVCVSQLEISFAFLLFPIFSKFVYRFISHLDFSLAFSWRAFVFCLLFFQIGEIFRFLFLADPFEVWLSLFLPLGSFFCLLSSFCVQVKVAKVGIIKTS